MRRSRKKVALNTKLITDVGIAGIATRILPMVINKFFPLDPTIYSIAGAGGTYVLGSLLKKPDMANAGIALGLVEFISPMIENVVGGITGTTSPALLPATNKMVSVKGQPMLSVADYQSINLNDAGYTDMTKQFNYDFYRDFYE